jgi:glycosyltransferase involved in cell wall biosynthesis
MGKVRPGNIGNLFIFIVIEPGKVFKRKDVFMINIETKKEVITDDLLVTVITPTYNQGEFIEDTIKSVIFQTYKNIEYLIIDNESDDKTEQIVNQYRALYGNIRYIREKDSGQADALNKGFNLANGNIVCWLNSDDYYAHNNVIEKIVGIFSEKQDIDVIFGNGYCCDKLGNISHPHMINTKHVTMKYLNILCPILQPSSFWRKNDFRLHNEYTYGFDWILFREMFMEGLKFHYFNEHLSVYRMYENNKTGADSWKRRKELYCVVRKNIGKYNLITFGFFMIYLFYRVSQVNGLGWVKGIVRKVSEFIGRKI